MSNRDLSEYLLGRIDHSTGQIAQTLHSNTSALAALQETVEDHGERLDRVTAAMDQLTTWAQRMALLATLWGAAVGLNVAPDKVGELLATLLKSAK